MLAFNEIRYRKVQFALIVAIVALIGYLVVMISALGVGLREQSGSYIRGLDVDSIAYNATADLSALRSEVSAEQQAAVAAVPGVVSVAPVGFVSTTAFNASKRFAASLIGYVPGTAGEPRLIAGRPLAAEERDALLADREFLRRYRLKLGDEVHISQRLQTRSFRIVGVVDAGSFFFQPVLFAPLGTWQQLRYGEEGGNVPAGSVLLIRGSAPPREIDAAIGTVQTVTPDGAFNAIEGVAEQNQTVRALQTMGYLIGALVVGMFFYVLTLQKVPQIGMLKALGASGWYIFRQVLVQVLALTVAGLAIAIPLALATQAAIPEGGIPIAFTRSTYVLTVLGLLIAGVLGALFSGRRVAKVDPIIALGQQQ
jgi:putative ABC transport system permease protein